MAYLKNWTDNFLQMFLMGTSWVAVSINNGVEWTVRNTIDNNSSTLYCHLSGLFIHVSGKPSFMITTYQNRSIPLGTLLQKDHVLSRTALYIQHER